MEMGWEMEPLERLGNGEKDAFGCTLGSGIVAGVAVEDIGP